MLLQCMYCMSGLRASLRRFRYYRLLCQRRSRWPVGSQVSEFMRQPESEGVINHISVAVDEHASAGQVREYGAGICGWHMEAKCYCRVGVLLVRHKENSQKKNVGLHDPNLNSYQSFAVARNQSDCSLAKTNSIIYARSPRSSLTGTA